MDVLDYRRATTADLDALVALELTFPGDRLTRRSFRQLLRSAAADVWVCASRETLHGNAVVLYRRGTTSARLYSIVVADQARGRGIATTLVRMAETAAVQRGCTLLRLEVRLDNLAAQALYERLGYTVTRVLSAFYDDGQDALCLQRELAPRHDIAA